MSLRVTTLGLLAAGTVVLSGCSDSSTAPVPSPTLTIKGSSSAPPALAISTSRRLSFSSADPQPGGLTGDPSSISLGMYALYISTNADCSGYTTVVDHGTTVDYKDFAAEPTLFEGSPTDGTYNCVALRMSDVIRFQPATTFGGCVAGTDYAQDIYRSDSGDESAWKDIDLNDVVGTGTDSIPVDDHVTIVMTTDTAAAIARGFSSNQIVALGSPLVVPGANTFYWGAAGSVSSADGVTWCGLEKGNPAFR
jgi:hypothetical protein